MNADRVERKLTTILSADVAGYSRLVGEAEEDAVRDLKACLQVVAQAVADHRGRIFNRAGDSAVAEFASPVEAVRCAARIQRAIAERNAGLPEGRGMRFRIGVHLGDVIVDGDNLLGDGVNVAARLQALAEPGGVSISRPVRDQVEGKLAIAFADAGEHRVKNIRRPVQVWCWTPEGADGKASAAAAGATPGAADRPSIAVLPFDDHSLEPDERRLGDGIAEDIITDLSALQDLVVMSRNSVWAYKGRQVNALEVAAELGVRYVLVGSAREAGGRVRINAQLVDAASGAQLWAARYDRELTDVFAVQDEITAHIVSALAGYAVKPPKPGAAPARYEGLGTVIEVEPRKGRIVLDHEEIVDYMEAMVMNYRVSPARLLRGLAPGDAVRFAIDPKASAIVEIARIDD